jgi:hypothetical protein
MAICYDLQLKRGGILVTKEWSVPDEDYVEREVSQDELPFHVSDSVCLRKDAVLLDVFLLLARSTEAFSLATACPLVDELVEEVHSGKVLERQKRDIARIEVRWSAFMGENDEKSFVQWQPELYGFASDGKECDLDTIPLSILSKVRMFLDEKLDICDAADEESVYFSAMMKFTLGDVLRAVVDGVSYGFMSFAELDAEIAEDESREDRLMDFCEKTRKLRMQNPRPCRMCGKDARSRHFGKPADLCIMCFRKTKEN